MKNSFISIAKELNSNKNFVLLHNEISKQTCDLDWNMMMSSTDIENTLFPTSYIEILNELNGVKLEWEVPEENTSPAFEEGFEEILQGRIWILDPTEIIGMHSMGMWDQTLSHHPASLNTSEKEIILPFDHYFPDYSGCACFRIRNNKAEENIVFHNKKFGFYYSHINLQEYFQVLQETRGLLFSREAIIFPESEAREKTIFYTERFFQNSKIATLLKHLDEGIVKK